MEFDFKQNYSKDSPQYEALEYVASKLSEMTDCEFTVGSTDIFKTTLLCDGIQVCANDLVNACNSLDLDNFCDEFIVHHGKEFAKLEQEDLNCFGALFGLSNEQEYYERLEDLIENEYNDIFVSDIRNHVDYELRQQLNGLDRAQKEQEKKSLGRGR